MSADADAEMREAIAYEIMCYDPERRTASDNVAAAILRLLRRRGAWLPGDPVTDDMMNAATSRLKECGAGPVFAIDLRETITAALAANAKARTE